MGDDFNQIIISPAKARGGSTDTVVILKFTVLQPNQQNYTKMQLFIKSKSKGCFNCSIGSSSITLLVSFA